MKPEVKSKFQRDDNFLFPEGSLTRRRSSERARRVKCTIRGLVRHPTVDARSLLICERVHTESRGTRENPTSARHGAAGVQRVERLQSMEWRQESVEVNDDPRHKREPSYRFLHR